MKARRSARHHVQIPVTIGRKKAFLDQRAGHGLISDMNGFGCRISQATPISQQETLALSFTLAGRDEPIHIPEAIVRWAEADEIGCEFVGLGPVVRDQLARAVPNSNAREFPRMPVAFPITYKIDGKEGMGIIYNISLGGCAVEGDLNPTSTGQPIQAEFDLSQNQQKICVEDATTCWVAGKRFGIQFSKVRPTEQESLSKFVREP